MSERRVALTFDAEHPSRRAHRPDGADEIVGVLSRHELRATFFLQGRWASAYPDTAHRIAEEGHLLGNHSNYHAPMTLLSEAGILEDVRRAEERIVDATGIDPKPWFRCPFGDGADRPEVRAALEGLGYRNVSWTIDPLDWEETAAPGAVASDVLADWAASSGNAIVVFHTWGASTTAALNEIVPALRGEGASFVTVSEIVDGA